jgi:hypothetical protein
VIIILLILEIWLTIKAWRKGWRALALLPGGIALGGSFVLGASGVPVSDMYGLCLIVDALVITILGVMSAKAPHKATTPNLKVVEPAEGVK